MLESKRPADKRSADWLARQRAKVEKGIGALERMLGGREHFVGDDLTVADIAAGAALGYVSFRMPEMVWRPTYPKLAAFGDRMEARPSFAATRPADQVIAALG